MKMGGRSEAFFLRCQGEDRKAVEMELEWVSGWEPVGVLGEIRMGIRSGGGWMPEGFWRDVRMKTGGREAERFKMSE